MVFWIISKGCLSKGGGSICMFCVLLGCVDIINFGGVMVEVAGGVRL